MNKIVFTGRENAVLENTGIDKKLEPDDIAGRTLFSVISTGTELARYKNAKWYPFEPGYASIFKVEEIGENVNKEQCICEQQQIYRYKEEIEPTKINIGDYIICEEKHRSYHIVNRKNCWKVHSHNEDIKKALFGRFLKIANMIEFTSHIRKGQPIQVYGRGLIAYFFRKHFETRNTKITDNAETAFICSGKEEDILKACKLENIKTIVIVGIEWENKESKYFSEIIRELFYKDIKIVSGWERVYKKDKVVDFFYNRYCNVLSELHKIEIGDIYDVVKPEDCQQVYQKLLYNRDKLTCIFDWR